MRGHGEDAAARGRAEHPARGPGRQPARMNEWRGPSGAGEQGRGRESSARRLSGRPSAGGGPAAPWRRGKGRSRVT